MNSSLASAQSLVSGRNPRLSNNLSHSWVPSLRSCTAFDIVKFLIYSDKSGRTVVHSPSCSKTDCLKHLAAGSVDSLLGRLRAIFNNLGRLNDSNPVAHFLVKDYLKFMREEQAGLAITPSQAVPLFLGKVQRLIAFFEVCVLAAYPFRARVNTSL